MKTNKASFFNLVLIIVSLWFSFGVQAKVLIRALYPNLPLSPCQAFYKISLESGAAALTLLRANETTASYLNDAKRINQVLDCFDLEKPFSFSDRPLPSLKRYYEQNLSDRILEKITDPFKAFDALKEISDMDALLIEAMKIPKLSHIFESILDEKNASHVSSFNIVDLTKEFSRSHHTEAFYEQLTRGVPIDFPWLLLVEKRFSEFYLDRLLANYFVTLSQILSSHTDHHETVMRIRTLTSTLQAQMNQVRNFFEFDRRSAKIEVKAIQLARLPNTIDVIKTHYFHENKSLPLQERLRQFNILADAFGGLDSFWSDTHFTDYFPELLPTRKFNRTLALESFSGLPKDRIARLTKIILKQATKQGDVRSIVKIELYEYLGSLGFDPTHFLGEVMGELPSADRSRLDEIRTDFHAYDAVKAQCRLGLNKA